MLDRRGEDIVLSSRRRYGEAVLRGSSTSQRAAGSVYGVIRRSPRMLLAYRAHGLRPVAGATNGGGSPGEIGEDPPARDASVADRA
jgi:hypothetical protein